MDSYPKFKEEILEQKRLPAAGKEEFGMDLFCRIRVKATGKAGTIIEKGKPKGEILYLVELDDAASYESVNDALPTFRENEIEPIESPCRHQW